LNAVLIAEGGACRRPREVEMKEILVPMAEYNGKANAAMRELLAKVPEALLKADQKVYYKSMLGTFHHIVMAELSWLRRYRGFFSYPALDGSALLARDAEELKAESGESLAACARLSAEVDALFVSFAKGLDEADLLKRVSYTNMMGERLERTYWQTVFHVLNHGTHHRGEISAVLDQNGIANDLSGFTKYWD
jgi:uncharacterized damage-inducible protein DinB